VLLLEVLEKPQNLIFDFKGTLRALEKKNFLLKVLENNENSLNFCSDGK